MRYFIEYGKDLLSFETANPIDIAGMQDPPKPVALPQAIQDALAFPYNCESLFQIAREKMSKGEGASAIIVVSDNTRPVPYYGENGIIYQTILVLTDAGFSHEQISILIGAGSHRNMEEDEIEEMMGMKQMGLGNIRVLNHEYDQENDLISLGYTRQGSQALINKKYYQSDLKIVTGLVESHFMAGASGGRKGICPGIVGKETLTLFHGAGFLSSLNSADLILSGNPLHEEASEIAHMAGCDFLVNVTIDSEKEVTGVFAGDLRTAHQAAVAKINEYVTVPLDRKYDIVIIPAGFVGINHYQAAKAAIEAARAVKQGGKIIIVAKNTDLDPVGGDGYKSALKLLAKQGRVSFMKMISESNWKIIQEQWQVQMWCKVLDVIEKEDNLYYCSLEISESDYDYLPGVASIRMLDQEEKKLPPNQSIKLMIERSLSHAMASSSASNPTVLLLKDGPYGIPIVS